MTYLKRIKFIFKQVWRKMLQKYMLILSVNFENIIVGLLCHQINVKISKFYDLNIFIKNKFIDQIANNI